jgi:hypothetical protein
MDGVVLLSEAHPNGLKWIDPVHQALEWFGLINDIEADQLRREDKPFETLVALCAARCEATGRTLVVRDWTHLDYTGVPFLEPRYKLTTRERLADAFDRVHATATVRHPIDQWLSLNKLPIVRGRLPIKDYMRGYRAFAEAAQEIGFVRYEDFTHDPDQALASVCSQIGLAFDEGYRTRWPDYTRITGDVAKEGPPRRDIRPIKSSAHDAEIMQAFAAQPDFKPALDLLGYTACYTNAAAKV